MTTPVKTVALLDSRWNGHHPTYFREFLASLLRLDVRVIALCPEPEEFAEVAAALCLEQGRDPEEWVVTGSYTSPAKSFLFPGMDHDPVSALWRWFAAGRALRRAEKRSKWKSDLVFFPWLDSYLRFLPHWRWTEWTLRRPWAGLYFRSHHLSPSWMGGKGGRLFRLARYAKGDFNLKAPRCRAVAVLDERFAGELAEVCGKPVIIFPDVTDTTLPEEQSPIQSEVARRASKRKVIGMIGLEKRKGFLTLLRAAVRCSEVRPWYFVFAGAMSPEGLSREELEWVEVVDRTANQHGELENTFLDRDGSRMSESEYNGLLNQFDLVFAAYCDFQGSSNTLTKAAFFEKPVIVSKGDCMEKRVRDYALGIVVDQGDVDQVIDAIEKLLEGKDSEGAPLASRFEDYQKRHSRERLDEVFREILDQLDSETKETGREAAKDEADDSSAGVSGGGKGS